MSRRRPSSARCGTGRSYDAGKGDPAAWLVGIARRTIDEHYRRQALAETVATVPERVDDDPFEDRSVERLAMAAAVGPARPARTRADRPALRRRPDRTPDCRSARPTNQHRRGGAAPGAGAAPRPGRGDESRTGCKETGVRIGRGDMNDFDTDFEHELHESRPAPRGELLDSLVSKVSARPAPARKSRWQLRLAGVMAAAALVGLALSAACLRRRMPSRTPTRPATTSRATTGAARRARERRERWQGRRRR